MRARRQQAKLQCGLQRRATAGVTRMQILGQIGGAHNQAAGRKARGGDIFRAQYAPGRFDHAPDGVPRRSAGSFQNFPRLLHRVGAFHLGQHDRVDRHCSR